MNIKWAALTVLLLSSIVACQPGTPVELSEAVQKPEPPRAATASVDYPGEVHIFTTVGTGASRPVALVGEQKVSGSHVFDRDGAAVAFGVRVGTYHGTADGALHLSLCVNGDCREAQKSVVDAADNDYLLFALAQPLTVVDGSILRYEFTRSADAKRRLAIWAYPKLDNQSGIVDPSGQEVPFVPRLSIHLQ